MNENERCTMMTALPTTARIILAISFGILIFIGLLGNFLVCISVFKSRKLRKKRYAYFVSLSVADLLLCIFVMPFAAIHDLHGRWIFGPLYCHIWLILDVCCCTSSILHLCAVSIDRYYFVHDPMHYRERNTRTRVATIIFSVWIASLAVAASALGMPANIVHKNSTTHHQNVGWGNRSSVESCEFSLDPIYAIILSSISFYIPCIIMIATYRKLYIYARKHSRMIGHQLRAAAEFLLTVALQRQQKCPEEPEPDGKKFRLTLILRRMSRRRHKRTNAGVSVQKAKITLGVTMGMFIFSWLGYFVCNIVRSFSPDFVPHWLFVALTWLGYANSAQNPIIYSIFNKDFHSAFARILSMRRRRKKKSSAFVGNSNVMTKVSLIAPLLNT